MTIPYTVDRRPDTGVSNVTLGVWLFLASEVMLFGALFSAYALLRSSSPSWPSGLETLSLTFGAGNTAILVIATMLAWQSRRAAMAAPASIAAVRGWLLAATTAGAAFVVVKGLEYRGEIARGLVPSVNTFVAMYFVLTGLHAVHVVGGMIANLWAAAGAVRVGAPMTAGRVRAITLYWAFVDLVWLVILVSMYLT
ncbi:MAG TPA: cytochrome c oxidase subunit 3 [Vicinamibacterales bacterium]|nr:cytochrome c oxidase subunit 3 [Vicinamibacterales bacterium]